MKTPIYFFIALLITIMHNPIQKLHAMEHDIENPREIENPSQKKILKKSKKNESLLTWCVDTNDLENLPGEKKITRKINKKKKKKAQTSAAIHQQLEKADNDNNTMAALRLMNTIQIRQNAETRELLQLVSDNTGKQITDILITINDKNDVLQKQLARDNTKKSIGIAIFTAASVVIASIITASSV